MFENTKRFFKAFANDFNKAMKNFIQTGDPCFENPSVALSVTEFENFSVNTVEARNELVALDGVQVLENPDNKDLNCLKHVLAACGHPNEEIDEINLKAGIFSFLKYSPFLIREKITDVGLAYLFRKNDGSTYYLILREETEKGSILLFEQHYMLVKNLPKPYREMKASFGAKVMNFCFGMLFPGLGFNSWFRMHDTDIDGERFEDEDEVNRYLLQLILKQFPNFDVMNTEEDLRREIYNKFCDVFKSQANNKHVFMPFSTFKRLTAHFTWLDIMKKWNAFVLLSKYKQEKAYEQQCSFKNYNCPRQEQDPIFYPPCVRKLECHESDIIYVEDLTEEKEFWGKDSVIYEDEETVIFKNSAFVFTKIPGKVLAERRSFLSYTTEIYHKDILNIALSKVHVEDLLLVHPKSKRYITDERFVKNDVFSIIDLRDVSNHPLIEAEGKATFTLDDKKYKFKKFQDLKIFLKVYLTDRGIEYSSEMHYGLCFNYIKELNEALNIYNNIKGLNKYTKDIDVRVWAKKSYRIYPYKHLFICEDGFIYNNNFEKVTQETLEWFGRNDQMLLWTIKMLKLPISKVDNKLSYMNSDPFVSVLANSEFMSNIIEASRHEMKNLYRLPRHICKSSYFRMDIDEDNNHLYRDHFPPSLLECAISRSQLHQFRLDRVKQLLERPDRFDYVSQFTLLN